MTDKGHARNFLLAALAAAPEAVVILSDELLRASVVPLDESVRSALSLSPVKTARRA